MVKANRNSLVYFFYSFHSLNLGTPSSKKMSFQHHKSFFPESSHEIGHTCVNKRSPQELFLAVAKNQHIVLENAAMSLNICMR